MRSLHPLALLAALALGFLPAALHAATRTWDGETSGDWQDVTNWDGNLTAPAANDTVVLGPSANRTITNANVTVSLLFLGAADGNYSVTDTGTAPRLNAVTVEGSASATEHAIAGWRFNSITFNVQSASTALRWNSVDWGGNGNTMTKIGAGTLFIAADPLNSGDLKINAGLVDVQANLGLNGGAKLRLSGTGGELTASATARTLLLGKQTGAVSVSYSGLVSGNLSLQLGDPASASDLTQTLSGNNTYTGATSVRGASLFVNGSTSGQGDYVVTGRTSAGDDNGLLGGTGSIGLASGRALTVANTSATNSLAILYPGANATDTTDLVVGTPGNGNAVTLGPKSVLRLDVGAAGASDQLVINGDFSLANTASLDLVSLAGAFDGSSYTIVTWTGSFLGDQTFGPVTGLAAGYAVNYGSQAITLVIPEPATGLVLLAGGLLMLRRRR